MKKNLFLIPFIGFSEFLFSQNVGIGTNTPLEKLSVVTNYGYGISHEANTIKLSTYIDASGAYVGTISNHPFHFYTNNGAAQMTLNSNGNIGIGNIFPAAKFDISHTSSLSSPTLRLFDNNSSNYSRLRFQNSSGANYWDIAGLNSPVNSAERLNFYNSTTGDIMSITGNGNVGIGTTNPSEKIQVNGNVKANSFNYNTPKTLYYSIPPAAFIPKSFRLLASEFADFYIEREGWASAFQYLGNSQGFVAPVNLPHGATVTGLRVFLVDNSPTDNLTFELKRRLHEGDFYLSLCTLTSSGTPGNSNISSTTIGFPVIDNQYYNYTITAIPAPDAHWSGSELQIKSVLITYTVPAAD